MDLICDCIASWLHLHCGNNKCQNSEIDREGQKPFSLFRKNVTTEIQGLDSALENKNENPWGAMTENPGSSTPRVSQSSGLADGIVDGQSQTSEVVPKPQRCLYLTKSNPLSDTTQRVQLQMQLVDFGFKITPMLKSIHCLITQGKLTGNVTMSAKTSNPSND